MKLIACSHPGKMGDVLWALPTVRALCRQQADRLGEVVKCDFFTSDYCLPLRDLFEAQSSIRQVVVPAAYEIKAMDCGVQPWEMPIDPRGYEAVYQLGFRGCPQGFLAEAIAESAGLPRTAGQDVRYDLGAENMDELGAHYTGFSERSYIVLAPRGETSYAPLLRDFAVKSPFPTVEIGAVGQAVIPPSATHRDKTCRSVREMARIIAGAHAYIGLMSAPLVIAGGFPNVKKLVPHNGHSWDMSHVMTSPHHHYLVEPTVADLLKLL